MESDVLGLGFGHGKSLRIKLQRLRVPSLPVHHVRPLDLVQRRRCHQDRSTRFNPNRPIYKTSSFSGFLKTLFLLSSGQAFELELEEEAEEEDDEAGPAMISF